MADGAGPGAALSALLLGVFLIFDMANAATNVSARHRRLALDKAAAFWWKFRRLIDL